jgi:hypothetical protein
MVNCREDKVSKIFFLQVLIAENYAMNVTKNACYDDNAKQKKE